MMIHFQDSVIANLAYWEGFYRTLTEWEFTQFDPEQENLRRAVAYGLSLPATWESAALFQVALVEYIEARGLWGSWMPLFTRALASCPKEAVAIRGKLACRLGFFYRLERQFVLARQYHEQAAALAEQTGERSEQGMAALGLADESLLTMAYAAAAQYAQMAIDFFLQAGEQGTRLRAAFNLLGICAYHQGQFQEAERWYREALAEKYGADMPRKRGQVLVNLAHSLRDLARYGEAQACLEDALIIFQETHTTLLWQRAQLALGTLHFAQQAWAAAEAAFQALDVPYLHQFGQYFILAEQANNLGNVYLQTHRDAEAAEQLAYAAQLFRTLEDGLNLGNTLGDLGESYWRQGRPEQARVCWEEALARLQAHPQNAWAMKRAREVQMQLDRKTKDKS